MEKIIIGYLVIGIMVACLNQHRIGKVTNTPCDKLCQHEYNMKIEYERMLIYLKPVALRGIMFFMTTFFWLFLFLKKII